MPYQPKPAMIFAHFIAFTTVPLSTGTGDETGLMSQLISTPSLTTQPMKGCTHLLLFMNSSVGSFMSHKNQNSERAVRQGLCFFVLIRED